MEKDLKVKMILATSLDGVIGDEYGLIWDLPEDLQFYKKTTTGKVLIVGKTTYMSLPKVALENRKHIVLTTDESFVLRQAGDITAKSVKEALELAKSRTDEVFVIGGASVYNIFFELSDEVYVTWINKIYDNGDPNNYKTININVLFEEFSLINETEWRRSENGITYKISYYKNNNL